MTVWNGQVGASSDDARQNSGAMNLTNTSHSIFGAASYVGFRFTSVTVPQGATINSAVFSPYLEDSANASPNTEVYLQNADDAATFTTATNDISSRPATSTVGWSGTSLGVGYENITVTSLVQAVVNRAGWVSGNNMVVIVHGLSGSDVEITTYDGSPANAATLTIDYTAAGGGVATKAMYYARQRSN